MYYLNEIFYSICGEGSNTGRAAVFVRFSGCNLWSGREEDRARAICKFCDTNFINGKPYLLNGIIQEALALWPRDDEGVRLIVLTGGEPALQIDQELVDELHRNRFEIQIETNGTKPIPKYIDYITLSPKAGTELVLSRVTEVKLVYPQAGINPAQLENIPARHYYLQPKDGPDIIANTRLTIDYCLKFPNWKLSIQTHKLIGIK